MMSTNAWWSIDSDIARRSSGLSNGGFSRLISRWRLTLLGVHMQIDCGTCPLMSFISGTVTWPGAVISNFPAMKAKTAVAWSGIIVCSMPSR
jgi:hypothetical protein